MRLWKPVSPAHGRPRQDGGDSKTLRSCFYLKVKERKGEQEKERVRGFIVSVLISWFRQQV